MCLASVYYEKNCKKELLMKKAASINIVSDNIICRDFLGREISVDGVISSIDLENNIVICKGRAQG